MPILSLNGTNIYPSDVSRTSSKIGVTSVTANGGRTFIHRTTIVGVPIFKDEIDLTFNGVTAAIRAQLEALANVATTMTFVDDTGASYTVQCEDGAYQQNISVIAIDGTLRYDVSLKLFES